VALRAPPRPSRLLIDASNEPCAHQGVLFYSHGRDIGALHAAETAVKDLLMSSSFELRAHAQNIAAASSLLAAHNAVDCDSEALFLASALSSSCNLLLGARLPCVHATRQRTCERDAGRFGMHRHHCEYD
jgi:hypothetical protein